MLNCMKSRIDCFPKNGSRSFQWMAMGSFLTLLMLKLHDITDIGWQWVFMPLIIYGVLLAITGILITLLLVIVHWRNHRDYDGHE